MSKTVVVIDDEELNRELARVVLEIEGYCVVLAQDAKDGVAAAICQDGGADAILVDLMMPKIDGFETIRMLRSDKRTRSVPIMALTALNDKESVLKAVHAGADDYLSKPFNIEDLKQKVKSLVKISDFIKRWELVTK